MKKSIFPLILCLLAFQSCKKEYVAGDTEIVEKTRVIHQGEILVYNVGHLGTPDFQIKDYGQHAIISNLVVKTDDDSYYVYKPEPGFTGSDEVNVWYDYQDGGFELWGGIDLTIRIEVKE